MLVNGKWSDNGSEYVVNIVLPPSTKWVAWLMKGNVAW